MVPERALSFFHTFQALSFYVPSPSPISLVFFYQVGFGLAGPYPRLQLYFLLKHPTVPWRGGILSEFADVVKSRAGELTTDTNAVLSKYRRGAGLGPPLSDLVLSRATTSSTSDAVRRKYRSL